MPKTVKNSRWAVLDIAKAIAVIFMLLGHNLMWWYVTDGQQFVANLEIEINLAPLIFGVFALFVMSLPITAGMALRFYFRRAWDTQKQKLGKQFPFLKKLRVALYVVLCGFLLNYLNWGTDDIFLWNVLAFFGLSLFTIIFFLKFFRWRYLQIFALTVLLSAPWLRAFFWRDGQYSYPEAVFFGEPGNLHDWPFFPWFAIIVSGFFIADFYLSKHKKQFSKILSIAGSVLLLLALLVSGSVFYRLDFNNAWGANLFEPPTLRILGQLGFFAIFFAALNYFFGKTKLKKYGIINTFSHGILYIYLFNYTVGYHLTNFWKLQHEFKMLGISLLLQFIVAYLIGTLVVFLKFRKRGYD
ncbi:MAG: heparan-alpha-glucosaminide N-acetyltransferase domain-containing protein [Patescibacteria group bacterium]